MKENVGILMPEIIIYNTLQSIINFIRKDLSKNKDNDKETWLYKLLGVNEEGRPIKLNLYNYYTQAKKMFQREQNFSVNFGYNWEVAKFISLHIILPSESPISPTIGEDEGYMTDFDPEEGVYQEKFTQMFSSNYQIMISSENSNEVNVAYHILKAMMIALVPHLSILGLMNPKFSGNDIVFSDETHPAGIFHRVLNVSFEYEVTVPQLLVREMLKSVVTEGTPIMPDNGTFKGIGDGTPLLPDDND